MTGASPVTTIHGPAELPRSIVVAPLAGAMPPCGCHAPLRVPCPLAGAMPPCGYHPRLRLPSPLTGAIHDSGYHAHCGCHDPLRGQVIMPLDLVCNHTTN